MQTVPNQKRNTQKRTKKMFRLNSVTEHSKTFPASNAWRTEEGKKQARRKSSKSKSLNGRLDN
jgi:hypothetical protein